MVQILNLRSGKSFRMGNGINRRVVHPDMGAKNLTLNYGVHGPGREFPQHVHDSSEDIFIVLEGGVSVRQGDTYIPITKGDVAFVPAGEVHGTVNTTNAQATLISFQGPPDPALYSGERDSSVTGEPPKPPPGHRSKIQIRRLAEGEEANFGDLMIRKVVHQGVGSKNLALHFVELPPEGKVPDHSYPRSEEVWVLLEGEALARFGGKEVTLKAGDVMFVSPGEAVGLFNTGTSRAVFVNCIAPLGTPDLFT